MYLGANYLMSQGEQKIIKILQSAKIIFKREQTFPDLKSRKKKPLRYDFALYDRTNRIYALIEFDGEQHFTFNKHFSKTRSNFKYRQEMDLIKNNYAIQNNIPLFRIPFYDIDKLEVYTDLFKEEYKVTTKWHCHELKYKKKL